MKTHDYINTEQHYIAQNYSPLPVVLSRADGVWMYDVDGNKYLDFLSAYSAVSAGHLNKRIRDALVNQLDVLDVPSRAFYTDKLAPFAEKLCTMTGMDKMLPMNTGAEAVETAIKAARRWGYQQKGIAKDKANIIVSSGNFHGRTTTIVGFSSDEEYKENFGPFDGGFTTVPFGDADALEAAITPETCAYITEPMQGEGGIIIPPKGWLKKVQEICKKNNVLLILDEIQSGIGRTGKNFAFQYEIDKPDGLILGKALGGGIYPVSAFLARKDVMDIFVPGTHGSTFGGNPIAAAIGLEALNILEEEKLAERSRELGDYLKNALIDLQSPLVREVRGSGLWIGMDFDPDKADAHAICEELLQEGLLCKETHETVIRFAPPLTITKEDIDWAMTKIRKVLSHAEQCAA
ncbi:MAG: ornithine--oxo-acid transaminase [Alphaproteobacteria bacterium]|jgi:ornithine--oxo-acid transaminase|nr:ornithine--oxo-acid transaminase [Alphaproteobacteria bacterium]MDP7222612.1 ornithine--oxo-acid transaminase [Alphaproteobacteria bacterium]